LVDYQDYQKGHIHPFSKEYGYYKAKEGKSQKFGLYVKPK